jgi:hypothetical protein
LLVSTVAGATASFSSNVAQVTGSAYKPSFGTQKDILTFVTFDTTKAYLSTVKTLV